MYENCAFTGHRILKKDFDFNLLDKVILNLISGGTKNFYCGMAMGFDIAAAESVLNYKKQYGDVNLIALIPCRNQEENYTKSYKNRYEKILENCSEVRILSPEYYEGCMFARDRLLVDSSDVLVCYLRRKSGGTSYTVNYAKKRGKNIIEL